MTCYLGLLQFSLRPVRIKMFLFLQFLSCFSLPLTARLSFMRKSNLVGFREPHYNQNKVHASLLFCVLVVCLAEEKNHSYF